MRTCSVAVVDRRYLTRLTRFAGSKNWLCPDCCKIVRFACLLLVRNFLYGMQDAMQRRTDFLAANHVCLNTSIPIAANSDHNIAKVPQYMQATDAAIVHLHRKCNGCYFLTGAHLAVTVGCESWDAKASRHPSTLRPHHDHDASPYIHRLPAQHQMLSILSKPYNKL